MGLDRLRKLDLSSNNITSVQENSFSNMLELKELIIDTRSLLCDCKLKWFPAWLETTSFKADIIAVCAYPERLEGKFVTRVHPSNFTCGECSMLFAVCMSFLVLIVGVMILRRRILCFYVIQGILLGMHKIYIWN
jgi:hypothetical protein